jgi:hypothetical protein
MPRITSRVLASIAAIAVTSAAAAQNPQPAPPQVTNPPVAPPSASQPPPEQIAPGGTPPGMRSTENLSDKLARQQGTLHPPPVDPGISAPLPAHGQGTMPVIPPPGTPGGDQTVTPK